MTEQAVTADLVRRFVQERDHDAFGQLVRRNVDWVYGVACRATGRDAALAEDVTQAVFILLARKASGFDRPEMVGPWLFRTTQLIARDAVKRRATRARHEHRAARMRTETTDGVEDDGSMTREWVEEAVGRLRPADRDAIVLRFYEGLKLSEIARVLSVSEDAAKMRVTRAVARLRALLGFDGHPATLSAIEAALVVAQTPAPVRLVARVAAAATDGTVPASVAILVGRGARMVLRAKLQTATVLVTAAVAGAAGIAATAYAVATGRGATAAAAAGRPVVSRATALGGGPVMRGNYYIAGRVPRPGVYQLSGTPITLRQAIISAGGVDPAISGTAGVILTRRKATGAEDTIAFPSHAVFGTRGAGAFDRPLRKNDLINVVDLGDPADAVVAGDELYVSVLDLSAPGVATDARATVAADGTIELPLAGRVAVAARTALQVEEAVRQAYETAGMLANAQISVARVRSVPAGGR